MQEAAFLKKNVEKWKRLEEMLSQKNVADPDTLAALFLEITDDLSFAKTFYPNSKTTAYLNALAGRLHQQIYKNKKEDAGRFLTFWAHELPGLFWEHHRQLLYSFLFFIVAMGIGIVSAKNDQMFVRLILGDRYVNMTEANIEKGDPMAVYKQMQEAQMFLGITFNNIKVAFLCFAAGIFVSIGTVLMLFYNGVMLGAFQTFFYQKGLLGTALSTIWIHGTLEISAIVIAGCAGLVLGNSILFPGTYTRRQSVMRGAKRGLKIVVGLVPIFVAAGFLESFVTRHTEMPVVINLLIILSSLSLIIWYFITYPIQLKRRN